MAAESEKKLEELTGLRGAHNLVESLVRSIVNQSIGALDAFINQVGVQLVDCLRTGLEEVYAGSQLPFPYKLAYDFGVGATSAEV